jgi:hypothetical protein
MGAGVWGLGSRGAGGLLRKQRGERHAAEAAAELPEEVAAGGGALAEIQGAGSVHSIEVHRFWCAASHRVVILNPLMLP